ncbi:MAG: SIS domain-containing protein [Proteobacteria bacterium]|nr:MAG: SIS domain-containing protein [Pseudomonadota bacterium]
MDPREFINRHAERSVSVISRALNELSDGIADGAMRMIDCLERGGRVLVCGNGGSASDALHFSAELLNRYKDDRQPLAAIALNADVSTLTAIANDYHYDDVFAKQVAALGRTGDILLAITTSGNSGNVVKAIGEAHGRGVTTVLLTGRDGGACARDCSDKDVVLCVDDDATAHIQEAHGVIIHCLCALIERHFIDNAAA